ncbi:MAG: hypothetical protein DMD48_10015, partial [Gemmatimonadetes bacterium]
MLRPYLILATIATLAACASPTVRPLRPLRPLSGEVAGVGGGTDEVQALVRSALTLDAAGDRRADTLYTADAVVVENARIRLGAPRFAGISNGGGTGRVTISAASATVEGRMAWVLVEYQWVNPAERRVEAGRATFICERREGGWKIVHAHSSQPLPWE